MLSDEVLEVAWHEWRFYYAWDTSTATWEWGAPATLAASGESEAEMVLIHWAYQSPDEARLFCAAQINDLGGQSLRMMADSRVAEFLRHALRQGQLRVQALISEEAASRALDPPGSGRLLSWNQLDTRPVDKEYTAFATSRPTTTAKTASDVFATNRPMARASSPKPEDLFSTNRPIGLEKIVRIELLQGDQPAIRDVQQFVNLSRSDKWVDLAQIPHADRTGRALRFRVAFDRPGSFSFQVRIEPHPNNVEYSQGEKGRNHHFSWTEEERHYATEGDGTKVIDGEFDITVAGNDRFRLVARDGNGHEVRSAWVRNKRLTYCMAVKMQGMDGVAASIDDFVTEIRRHGIETVELPTAYIPHMPNISPDAPAEFIERVRTAYRSSEGAHTEPHTVIIAYTDQLAAKSAARTISKRNVSVGPGADPVRIHVTDRKRRSRSLWKDVVPGEGWFVGASFAAVGGLSKPIDEAACTPIPVNGSDSANCQQVEVKVEHLPAGTGTLTLKLYHVERMAGGLSFTDNNLICVCTRSWWRKKSAEGQSQILTHEMGHKCHMVPDGTGTQPERGPFHYTGRGHIGPHCHRGLELPGVGEEYRGERGSCVMFGSTNSTSFFCTDCSMALKKVDLCAGWPHV